MHLQQTILFCILDLILYAYHVSDWKTGLLLEGIMVYLILFMSPEPCI